MNHPSTNRVCIKFKCQSWDGATLIRPALVVRGKYWCCPQCGDSYGAMGDTTPYSPFDYDSVE